MIFRNTVKPQCGKSVRGVWFVGVLSLFIFCFCFCFVCVFGGKNYRKDWGKETKWEITAEVSVKWKRKQFSADGGKK